MAQFLIPLLRVYTFDYYDNQKSVEMLNRIITLCWFFTIISPQVIRNHLKEKNTGALV